MERILLTEEGREGMAGNMVSMAYEDMDLDHMLTDSERAESEARGEARGEARAFQMLLDNGVIKYQDLEKLSRKTKINLRCIRNPNRGR